MGPPRQLPFPVKEMMVSLAGACFWYWKSFDSLMHSSGVPRGIYMRYRSPAFNKHTAMRNILGDLENTGKVDVINQLISNFYRMTTAIDRVDRDEDTAKRLLQEFKVLVGSDPIERQINVQKRQEKQAEAKKRIVEHQLAEKELVALHSKLLELHHSSDLTPQRRGFELERLFFELLRINEFDYTPSYQGTGEQIDGHFKYGSFDYLIEIKWTQKTSDQADVSIFEGKIKGKAQSTRGLFLSMAGFNPNAINKHSGDSPKIILMDGRELMLILAGNVALLDAMKTKTDALVRKGLIYHPL